MKKLLTVAAAALCFLHAHAQIDPVQDTANLLPVELNAVRAKEKDPFAKTNLVKEQIRINNTGRDLPFILDGTPSVVVNSDAGNGIGYTNLRIRGTDATRINVTLNGIPYNDAESQGTFFVDLPDLATSASSIQIQRGVGTSSNGAGSFGASINLSTNEPVKEASLEINNSFGSFESIRNSINFNSGIFKKHFTVDARLSQIRTEGYIDRAAVRLRSYFTSFAWLNEKQSVRLNVFSGKEKTYQAWYGVNEVALDTNRTYNNAGTEKPGTPYANETDNYTQTHYQLFYDRHINKFTKANIAGFLTRGRGYYEQYKAGETPEDYNLPGTAPTDLIRQLWLDNYFYGGIFSVQYAKGKTQLIAGGGLNRYSGEHYGKLRQAEGIAIPAGLRWYDNNADKTDASVYGKFTQQLIPSLQLFADLQYRNVDYRINGFRNNADVKVRSAYSFLNPKAGLTYFKNNFKVFASYARAQKEPNRDDFETSPLQLPRAEILNDYEAGAEYKKGGTFLAAGFYHMSYRDQLVLTGKINDVGAYTRTNIARSYRTGVELQAGAKISKKINAEANLTLSKNKAEDFEEFIDDYDNGGQKVNRYTKPDLAFSPGVTGSASLNISPIKNGLITLRGKYVGDQFLDNTSDQSRKLDRFYTQDLRAAYSFEPKRIRRIEIFVQVYNLFAKEYEPNGYTFSYIYNGSTTTENFYFPMALRNYILGLNIKL